MQIARPHLLMALSAFTLIVAGYLLMAINYPVAYILATYEDFVGEWAQVFFFVVAFAFSLGLALARSQYRYFFLILAVACFYVFMEEISWGQRLFNIATPEFFQKHNLQQETNLHNLLVGPYSTALKQAIEFGLAAGLIGFGFLYPLLLQYGWQPAERLERKGIPAPPLYLWPFFTVAAFLELQPFGFNEAEVAEILVSSALAVFAMHHWICHRLPPMDQWEPCADFQVSRRIALNMALIILGVFLLAGATTYAAYATPYLRTGMDARFNNGIEKFAKRYQAYGEWSQAAGLYRLLNEREPGNPAVLRNLARAYKAGGDQASFGDYAHRALELDLAQAAAEPDNVATKLSLAQTYKLLREYEQSLDHLDEALRKALSQVQQQPESSSAAYWLGKVYEQRGDTAAALECYQRAVEQEPRPEYLQAYRELASRSGGGPAVLQGE